MGIFTKLLRDAVSNFSYKMGMIVPLYFTYIIGIEFAEQLSKQYNINKHHFKFGWNALHYSWVFFYIYLFINSAEKLRRKYNMSISRKC
jgi:hypothetical protein